MIKLRYTIAYVQEPARSAEFYERAFGLQRRFIHESGQYAEMETGDVLLAFASHVLGQGNLPGGYVRHDPAGPPQATELSFVTDDVAAAVQAAVAAGATALSEPVTKPWGQTVAYVRDPDGVLIELGTPTG